MASRLAPFSRSGHEHEQDYHQQPDPSFSALGDKSYLQSTPNRYRVQRNGPPVIVSSASEASTADSFQQQQSQYGTGGATGRTSGLLSSASEEEQEEEEDGEDADTEYAGTARKPQSGNEYWKDGLLEDAELREERQEGSGIKRNAAPAMQQAPSTSSSTLVDQEASSFASANASAAYPKTRSFAQGLQRPVSAPPVELSTQPTRRVSPLKNHIDRFASLQEEREESGHVHIPDPMLSLAYSQSRSQSYLSHADSNTSQQPSSSVARVHDIFARHIHSAQSISTSHVSSRSASLVASHNAENVSTAKPRQRLRDLLVAGGSSIKGNAVGSNRQRESSAESYEPSRAFKSVSPVPLSRSRTVPTHSTSTSYLSGSSPQQPRRRSTPIASDATSGVSLVQTTPSPSRRKRRQEQRQFRQDEQEGQSQSRNHSSSGTSFAKAADLDRLRRSVNSTSPPKAEELPMSILHNSTSLHLQPDDSDLLAQEFLPNHSISSHHDNHSFGPVQQQVQKQQASRLEREWQDIAARNATAISAADANEDQGNEGDVEPEEVEQGQEQEELDLDDDDQEPTSRSLAGLLSRHRHQNPLIEQMEQDERRKEAHNDLDQQEQYGESDDSSSFSPSLGGGDAASQSPEVQEQFSTIQGEERSSPDSENREVQDGTSGILSRERSYTRRQQLHAAPARSPQTYGTPARPASVLSSSTPLSTSAYKTSSTPLAPKTPHPPGWVAFTPQSAFIHQPVELRDISTQSATRHLSGLSTIQARAEEAEESLERSRTRLLGLPGAYMSPHPNQGRRVVSAPAASSFMQDEASHLQNDRIAEEVPIEQSYSGRKAKSRPRQERNHSVRFASPAPSAPSTPQSIMTSRHKPETSSTANEEVSTATAVSFTTPSEPRSIAQSALSEAGAPSRPSEATLSSNVSNTTATTAAAGPSTPSRSRSESTESVVHGLLSDLVKPLRSLMGTVHAQKAGKGKEKEVLDQQYGHGIVVAEDVKDDSALERQKWRLEQSELLSRLSEADRLDRSLSTKITEIRKAIDEMSNKLSISVSSVISESFARESANRKTWLLVAILCELLVLWIIFRMANMRADLLWKTTYSDPFYPPLYAYETDRRTLPYFGRSWLDHDQAGNSVGEKGWLWIYLYAEKFVMAIVGAGLNRPDFLHGTHTGHLLDKTASLGIASVTGYRVPT